MEGSPPAGACMRRAFVALVLVCLASVGVPTSAADPTWDWEVVVTYSDQNVTKTLTGTVSSWMGCPNPWHETYNVSTSVGTSDHLEKYRANYASILLSYVVQKEGTSREIRLACDGAFLQPFPANDPVLSPRECATPDLQHGSPFGGNCSFSCGINDRIHVFLSGFFVFGSAVCDGQSADCAWTLNTPLGCAAASPGKTTIITDGTCSGNGLPLLFGRCGSSFVGP